MLDLDSRQRAMLEAMGVPVWWPETPAPAATPPADADRAPTPPAASVVPMAPIPVHKPAVRPAVAPATATALAAPPRALGPHRDDIAAMDWRQLQAAVARCESCALCRTRTNTVFGVGPLPGDTPPQVDWLVVGEAPGENEDLAGEPFVGQAGKLLDNMLKAIGLSRHGASAPGNGAGPLKGAFIANVLKCRPPGNRNPAPEEVAHCLPYLERQVALLQPKIIVAAGRFAVQALLQDTVPDVHTQPLGKLRGRVHRYQGVPVVVTYHPAYLLRALPEKAKTWADLCLALDTLTSA